MCNGYCWFAMNEINPTISFFLLLYGIHCLQNTQVLKTGAEVIFSFTPCIAEKNAGAQQINCWSATEAVDKATF